MISVLMQKEKLSERLSCQRDSQIRPCVLFFFFPDYLKDLQGTFSHTQFLPYILTLEFSCFLWWLLGMLGGCVPGVWVGVYFR